MNEQLQQAVATMIQQALEAFNKGASFMAAEIPDVVNQLLMWHAVKSGVFFVLGLLLIFAIVYGNYRQYKWWVKPITVTNYRGEKASTTNWKHDNAVALFNIFQVLWVFPLGMTLNLGWLQIWIAPKVWLIEYAARMIK